MGLGVTSTHRSTDNSDDLLGRLNEYGWVGQIETVCGWFDGDEEGQVSSRLFVGRSVLITFFHVFHHRSRRHIRWGTSDRLDGQWKWDQTAEYRELGQGGLLIPRSRVKQFLILRLLRTREQGRGFWLDCGTGSWVRDFPDRRSRLVTRMLRRFVVTEVAELRLPSPSHQHKSPGSRCRRFVRRGSWGRDQRPPQVFPFLLTQGQGQVIT